MKNEKEFRDAVYEKAHLYEKKRRIRRRKLSEAVALCSVCIAIGISSFLLFPRLDVSTDESVPLAGDGAQDGYKCTSYTNSPPLAEEIPNTNASDDPNATFSSTPGVYCTSTMAPALTYTYASTAHTVTTTTEAISETTHTFTVPTFPEQSIPKGDEEIQIVPCHLQFRLLKNNANRHGIFIIRSQTELQRFQSDYLTLLSDTDQNEISAVYDNDYFSHSILIVIVRESNREGYRVVFQNGFASETESFGEELSQKQTVFHTYDIPIVQYESRNLLQYQAQ